MNVPGTSRPEREVAINDLRQLFEETTGVEFEQWVRSIYQQGFNDGLLAEDRRRVFIYGVLSSLKKKRGY